jgi:hypothetical protein
VTLPRQARRFRLGPLAVILIAACAAGLAFQATASPTAMAIVSGTVLTVVCIAGAVHYGSAERHRHLFSPPVLVLAYLALGVGIRGLSDILSASSKISAVADPSGPDFADLLTSVFLHTLLAVAGLLIGYELGRPRSSGPALTPFPLLERRRVDLTLAGGVAITAMAAAFFINRLGSVILTDPGYVAVEGTYGLFWLYPLMYLSLFAWMLPIVNAWSAGRSASTWYFIGLGLTSLLVYTLTSSKASLVNAVLLLVVCRHYAVRPVALRSLVILAIAFLVALPVLYLHRAVGVSPELLRRLDWNTLSAGAQIFLGRSYLADSFGAVLLYTPRVYPYRYGAPWLELFYFWIPRAWWPTKPVTFSIGFGETYLSSYEQGRLSYISPTLPGDAFLNFGTPGVFLVFLILGVLLRRWYENTAGRRPRPETILLYATSVYWIAIGAEQSVPVISELFLSYVVPVGVLMVLARGRRGNRGPTLSDAPAG